MSRKRSQKRLREIGNAVALLDDAAPAPVSASPVPARKRSLKFVWVALACMLSAAAAGSVAWFLKPAAASRTVSRFSIVLPPGQHFDAGRPSLAISPDGTRLVYAAAQGNSGGSLLQDVGGT